MRPKVRRPQSWGLAASAGISFGRLRICADLFSGGHDMADTPRLNGVISALEQGNPAFVSFCAAEIGVAQAMNTASYDGVVFEMEHRPYDIRALRDCLQYMLERRQILQRGTLAPAVTPFVRIPPNGGEASHAGAKQVLEQSVYGIVGPHLSTVDEARSSSTACRLPPPPPG